MRSAGTEVRRGATPAQAAARTLPGLEVVAELGRGARTVVHRVRRAADGHDYALKVLTGVVSDREQAARAFRREAAVLACVDHPGVVGVHEVSVADGRPYLVMDLVEGETLRKALSRGPLPEHVVLDVGIDAAEALHAAHRAGLVHRDVKPENLIRDVDGRTRVLDLGLTTVASEDLDGHGFAGTLAYSAPEQTGMLRRPVDRRADLYALGVVLFECLAGRPPFTGVASELLRDHAAATPPDLREVVPGITPALAAVVATLLAKDPDDRYGSGAALAADLRAIVDGTAGEGFTPARGPVPLEPPRLVGHRDQRALLRQHWTTAREGATVAVALRGPSGSGKTRLAEDVAATAGDTGAAVLWAAGGDPSAPPLQPLRTALDGYLVGLRHRTAADAADLLAALRTAAGPAAALLARLSDRLARALDVTPTDGQGHDAQFVSAAATLLAGIARHAGGAVLVLDDAQWLDPPTRRVIGQLLEDGDAPLLVLACVREDDDPAARPPVPLHEAFTDVPVLPLTAAASAELLEAHLGRAVLPGRVAQLLHSRAGGNPLALLEYLRALVWSGSILPSWGEWTLEDDQLAGLALHDGVVGLLLQRQADLPAEHRPILRDAALLGQGLTPELLQTITGRHEDEVAAAVAAAVEIRLLVPHPDGTLAFVHDRAREALVAELDEDAARDAHQRIAEAHAARRPRRDADLFVVARHLVRGHPDRNPWQTMEAGARAAHLALAAHAPEMAVELLEPVVEVARRTRVQLSQPVVRALAEAYLGSGRSRDALALLDRAVADEPRALDRAVLHSLRARALLGHFDGEAAIAAAEEGLDELGWPLPRTRLGLLLVGLRVLVTAHLAYLYRRRRPAFTAGEGHTRQLLRHELLGTAQAGAGRAFDLVRMCGLALVDAAPVLAIPRSPAFADYLCGLGALFHAIQLPRVAHRLFDKADAVAAQHGDPVARASVALRRGIAEYMAGRTAALRAALDVHHRFLSPSDEATAAALLGTLLAAQGHHDDAAAYCSRAITRLGGPEQLGAIGPLLARSTALVALGRAADAGRDLRQATRMIGAQRRGQEAALRLAELTAAVEQGELGGDFEDAVAALRRYRTGTGFLLPQLSRLHEVLGLLAKADVTGSDADRQQLLRDAARALRRLRLHGRAAPLCGAWAAVLRARLDAVRGRPRRAARALRRAERHPATRDAPAVLFEIQRVRALLHRLEGDHALTGWHAAFALTVAADQGWEYRARGLQRTFDLDPSMSLGQRSSRSRTRTAATGAATTAHPLEQRRADALLQVGLAASTILDPAELVRVALDEIVQILGAERGFLFRVTERDDGGHAVLPFLGRTAEGTDLPELTAYGASLVSRVAETGEAVVVTGTDEGAALGSASAVAHGLRSILVAPLELRGQLYGVVYVDSRVARGIFSEADIDLLTAVAQHALAALETARAARLETDIEAARRQRDLAEQLRLALADVTSTLDPDAVLLRVAATTLRLLPGNRARLLVPDDRDVVVRDVPDGHVTRTVRGVVEPRVSELLRAAEPVVGRSRLPGPLASELDLPAAWLLVPVVARHGTVGAVLLATDTPDAYGAAEVEIAAALAGQGAVAHDNAHLFTQVQRLATTDPLTGVANRRHFAARAETLLGEHRTVTALMLDIDHFKRVNDTYGHAVGDEVIREVARRLRACLRDGDLVGRYGGEEFAIAVAEVADAAELADRLLHVVADTPVATDEGPVPVTVSVGVAHHRQGERLEAVMVRADQALYAAKAAGRNCVVVA